MRMDNVLSTSGGGRGGDVDSVDLNDFQSDAELQLAIARLNNSSLSPRSRLEQEKRLRREIANSNERRRMQSINAGFQGLKNLLPRKDGDKMSKASILQQTAEYIYELKAEKAQLLQQNIQLKQLLDLREAALSGSVSPSSAMSVTLPTVPQNELGASLRRASEKEERISFPEHLAPPKKRKKFGSSDSSSDEGICLVSDADSDGAPRMRTSPDDLPPPGGLMSPSMQVNATTLPGYLQSFHTNTVYPQQPLPQDAAKEAMGATKLEGVWGSEFVQHTLYELRLALERERTSRLLLEDHFKTVEINARLQQELPRYPGLGPPVSSDSVFSRWGEQPVPHQDLPASTKSQLPPASLPAEAAVDSSLDNRNPLLPVLPAPIKHSVDALVAAANGVFRPTAISLAAGAGMPGQNLGQLMSPAISNRFGGGAVGSSLAQSLIALQQASSVLSPLANTSVTKQNLEAIVEAIRHLEGDQLFVEGAQSNALRMGRAALPEHESGMTSPLNESHPLAGSLQHSVKQAFGQQLLDGNGSSRPHIIMPSAAS